MANLNKANRQCCDVDIRVLKTKVPFLFFDTANTTTFGLSADSVYAKKKGTNAIAFSNPLTGTMSIEAQIKPFKFYSLLSDGIILATALLAEKKVVACTEAGKLTIPTGAKAGTVFVFANKDFGGVEIKGTFAEAVFTATQASDVAVGMDYEVGYFAEKTTGVNRISFNNKKIPQDYFITMSTLEKSEDGVITPYFITAYKATPKRTLDLSFSSEGDPANVKIDFDLLEDADGNVADMVEITDEE